jgi:hypothetical protein
MTLASLAGWSDPVVLEDEESARSLAQRWAT